MDVGEAITRRRAYRSLAPAEITPAMVEDLARHAQLAPSCFNNQPARFVFVYDPQALESLRPALTEANRWAFEASLIIAVFSRREDDCLIREREYHQFDCGLASAFLILRATELGLVAHPIAGYSPKKVKDALSIPDDYQVITLIICGRQASTLSPRLSEKQLESERKRPPRLPPETVAFHNRFPRG
jgi:nitroreductase